MNSILYGFQEGSKEDFHANELWMMKMSNGFVENTLYLRSLNSQFIRYLSLIWHFFHFTRGFWGSQYSVKWKLHIHSTGYWTESFWINVQISIQIILLIFSELHLWTTLSSFNEFIWNRLQWNSPTFYTFGKYAFCWAVRIEGIDFRPIRNIDFYSEEVCRHFDHRRIFLISNNHFISPITNCRTPCHWACIVIVIVCYGDKRKNRGILVKRIRSNQERIFIYTHLIFVRIGNIFKPEMRGKKTTNHNNYIVTDNVTHKL